MWTIVDGGDNVPLTLTGCHSWLDKACFSGPMAVWLGAATVTW